MRAILLLLLAVGSLTLSTTTTLGNNFTSPLSISSDGSISCGVQNSTLYIFVEDEVTQTLENVTRAALSGDAQWLITVNTNGTFSTYIRKRDSVWVFMESFQLPSSITLPRLLVDLSGSHIALGFFGQNNTFYLYSRPSNSTVFGSLWNLTGSYLQLTPDLKTAFLQNMDYSLSSAKVDWTLQKLSQTTLVQPFVIGEITINTDGSAFVWNSILYRNISQKWIASELYYLSDRSRYAFSGDGTFLFVSTPKNTKRFLLTDLTRAYLPSDTVTNTFGASLMSNENGSRIIISRSYDESYPSMGPGFMVKVDGPRYPARSICQDDTWCQTNLTCGPAHYCYISGTRSTPDNFTVTAYFTHAELQYNGPSRPDCIDAGSSPIDQRYNYATNTVVPQNTNLSVVIMEANGTSTQIDRGILSSNVNEPGFVGYHLEDSETKVQVWLTSMCADAGASSEKKVYTFEHVLPSTSADVTRGTTYNSASVLGWGCIICLPN
ncbi:hypothetical protein PROFUN_10866 [Planoprotostelium fungivorum]|uniref:Uncharacterized protein n=1 Tax=Planoprotostelium fungivorum TaxID=1890364 RepID=A0A2P6NCS7_9EUKA|nr:hypothetical protein PROFUN_10866 [Planoprotostelium fungivorum]